MTRYAILVPPAILLLTVAAYGRPLRSFWPIGRRTSTQSAKVLPGRLEGTVLTPDGVIIWEAGNHSGIHVRGVAEDGRAKFDVDCDTTMGGFYRVEKIPAGVYDLTIRTGYVNGIPYCPQQIFGVEIKPGNRTVLNIVMDQGEDLVKKGTPVYPTPAAARADEDARAAKAKALADAKAAVNAVTPTDPPATKKDGPE